MTLYDADSDDSSSDDGYGDLKASMSIANQKCGESDDGWSMDSDLLETISDEEFEPDGMPNGKDLHGANKYNKASISLKDAEDVGSDSEFEMATKLATGLDDGEHSIGSDDEFIPQTVSNTKKQFTRNDKEFDGLVPTSSKPHALNGGVGGGSDEGGGGGGGNRPAAVTSTPPSTAPQPEVIAALSKVKSLSKASKPIMSAGEILRGEEADLHRKGKQFAEASAKRRAVKLLQANAKTVSPEEAALNEKADAFRKQQQAKKGVQALSRQKVATASKKVLLTEKQTRGAMKEMGEKQAAVRKEVEVAKRGNMGDISVSTKRVAGRDHTVYSRNGKELTGKVENLAALDQAVRYARDVLKNDKLAEQLHARYKKAVVDKNKKEGKTRAYTRKPKTTTRSASTPPTTVKVGGNVTKLNV